MQSSLKTQTALAMSWGEPAADIFGIQGQYRPFEGSRLVVWQGKVLRRRPAITDLPVQESSRIDSLAYAFAFRNNSPTKTDYLPLENDLGPWRCGSAFRGCNDGSACMAQAKNKYSGQMYLANREGGWPLWPCVHRHAQAGARAFMKCASLRSCRADSLTSTTQSFA